VFFMLLNMNINIVDQLTTQNGQYLSDSSRIVEVSLTSTANASWWDGLVDVLWDTPKKYWTEDVGATLLSNAASTAAQPFIWVIEFLLSMIVKVLSLLVRAAGAFIDFSIDGKFVESVLIDNPGIYLGWSFVRDVLNLFFMFAFLFSAFATIFQVEKYHLKKIIILLIVMALLTNFSYPITLVVVDLSNSATFFLAENIFGSEQIKSPSAHLQKLFSTGPLLKSLHNASLDKVEILLYEIIFLSGVFFVSMAYGFMLIIRLIILGLLLVFSPVGFVFAFFPGTKSLADSWWSNLFKYAMMGPILLFMLLLSFVIFSGSIQGIAAGGEESSFFNSLVSGFIPMIFLMAGFVFAQKIGGAASEMGMKTAGIAKAGAMKGFRVTGIPGGLQQRYASMKRKAEAGIKSREARVASAPLFTEGGRFGADKIAKVLNATADPSAKRRVLMDQAKEYENEDENVLKKRAAKGDAAAAYRLAQDGNMDDATYAEVDANITDKAAKEMIDGKVKEKRIDLIIKKKIKEAGHSAGSRGAKSMAEAELLKLNKDSWAKQDFKELLSNADLADAARAIFTSQAKMHRDTKKDIRKSVNGENLLHMSHNGLV
ncbi:type IV secretion system protein, partial [Patescibacteria group bacterium]